LVGIKCDAVVEYIAESLEIGKLPPKLSVPSKASELRLTRLAHRFNPNVGPTL
jgi:hypothetical protein